MSRNHIDLITFNRFIQGHFRLAGNHTLAQLVCHVLDITRVQLQLLGDLAVGQVKPHEIQAQHPHRQWLMMAFEGRPR